MSKFKPANNIQDLQYFGEFGCVNPSITDSSTYTFLKAGTMEGVFEGGIDGLVRISTGFDNDIERTYQTVKRLIEKVG